MTDAAGNRPQHRGAAGDAAAPARSLFELQVGQRRRDDQIEGALRHKAIANGDDQRFEAHFASVGFRASASRSVENAPCTLRP